MDELDRRETDTWKVARKERIDAWISSPVTGPGWFASLDGEILAANTETLIWWHLRSCAHALYLHVPAFKVCTVFYELCTNSLKFFLIS